MTRVTVKDAHASVGGVAHVVIEGHDSLLSKPELVIKNKNTSEHASETDWVRNVRIVVAGNQEIKDGSLVLELDGPLVDRVIEEYLPVTITVPELDLTTDLQWPSIAPNYSGNTIPKTRVLTGEEYTDGEDEQEDEEDNEEEEEHTGGTGGGTGGYFNPPPAPPPPPSNKRWMWFVVAGFLLGAGLGYFFAGAQGTADRAELEQKITELNEELTLERERTGQLTDDLAEQAEQLRQTEGELDQMTASNEALRAEVAALERLLIDTNPVGLLDLPDQSPSGSSLDDYLGGTSIADGAGNILYQSFRRNHNGDNFTEEDMYLLKAAALHGDINALSVLGQIYVGTEPYTKERVFLGIHYLTFTANQMRLKGNATTADELAGYARSAYATHRELLLSDEPSE
ncbi:MAG: hypothetical protein AB8B94_14275 [Hyphomicrobiales bacterium]